MSRENSQNLLSSRSVAKAQVNPAHTRYRAGKALVHKGRWQEAIAYYRKALELDPNLTAAQQELDQLLTQNQEASPSTGGTSAKTSNGSNGNNGNWVPEQTPEGQKHRKQSQQYARQGQWQEAARELQQLIAVEPSFEAYRDLGRVQSYLQQPTEAAKSSYQAVSLAPDRVNAEQFGKLGNTLAQQKQYEAAASCYRQALERNPNWFQVRLNLATVLARQEQWEDAIAAYRDALAINSDSAKAHQGLAMALERRQQWEDAIASYRQAMTLQPEEQWIAERLVTLLEYQQDWEQLEIVCRQSIEHHSNVSRFYHLLGDALSKLGRWEEAVDPYRQAIALEPEFSWSHNNLGDALLQLERWEEAAEAYRSAIALKDDFAWSHYNLGEALSKLQHWEEAIEAYHRAKELQPNFSKIKEKLANTLLQRGKEGDETEALQIKQQMIADNNPNNDSQNYHKDLKTQSNKAKFNLQSVEGLSKQEQNEEVSTFYQEEARRIPSNYSKALENLKLGNQLAKNASSSYRQAMEYYRQAIRENPKDWRSCCKALEFKPNDAELYLFLISALESHGQDEKALAICKIASQLELNEPKFSLILSLELERFLEKIGRTYVERFSSTFNLDQEQKFLYQIRQIYQNNPSHFDEIKATIVMPTYNRANTIISAINSVICQSHQNWHLIIVDDGSLDNTEFVVKKYLSDSRITYIKQENAGVSSARNRGLEEADGDYVFYLDSDNQWQSTYLRNMIVLLVVGQLDSACACMRVIKDDGTIIGYRGNSFFWQEVFRQNYIDLNVFCHRNFTSSNKEYFDQNLKRLVDWDFILRVTKSQNVGYAPFIGATYLDSDQLAGRITTSVPLLYEPAIRQKHLIDWSNFENRLCDRIQSLVSIIIPIFNDSNMMIIDCVQSIQEKTLYENYEIIVIDNGSDQALYNTIFEKLKSFNKVKLYRNEQNLMFSLGNNVGFSKSFGHYIVFLNNDTLVTKGWLSKLIEPLQSDEQIGLVGSKLLFSDQTLQCGGLVFNRKSKIPYHIYQGFSGDHEVVNKKRYFQAVTGACMACRAKDYIEVRGFDPLYVNGCEDLDLCFKIRTQLNKLILYNPESTIYHLESKTPGRSKFINNNRSRFVELWKDLIQADDEFYYDEDGIVIEKYEKPGKEEDGETASYVPIIRSLPINKTKTLNNNDECDKFVTNSPEITLNRVHNIGFSSIWHERGISFHTKQLADALETEKNLNTYIFARWESERFCNQGKVYHPRVFNAGDDPSEETIVSWAKDNSIDLMIFMEVHPKDWKRVKALQSSGIRVMCYENLDTLRKEYWNEYKVFDYFLFNTFYAWDVFQSKFPDTPSLLIPWGTSCFVNEVEASDHEQVRFLHVAGWGGINSRKNSRLVFDAFLEAQPENAELHFYTQAPLQNYDLDTDLVARASSKIKVFEGTVEDIQVAYKGVDVLLFPSKREGVGLPIVEALASGIPVVTTDGYMMKEWLIPGKHGLLCQATPKVGPNVLPEMDVDREDLVRIIRELSANDSKLNLMKESVAKDRDIWIWGWQTKIFIEQISQIVQNPNYYPDGNLSYLPRRILEFEEQRLQAQKEQD